FDVCVLFFVVFFFSSRRRHTRFSRDWSSDVCSSDLIKADFGYDYMKNGEDSNEFRTKYYRASLQGVANLGRIMNFEDWTKVLNLQAHMGAGYSWMTPGKDDVFADGAYDKDQMAHVVLGLTGQ